MGITAFLSFLVVCVFNALSGLGDQLDLGLFKSSNANVSNKYSLEITPSGWTFSIWGAIYIFQALFMIYALCTLCIRTSTGWYIYTSPAFISSLVYVMYTLNMGSNLAWIFLFDEAYVDTKYLNAALGVLVFCTFSLYFCIGAAMKGLR